MGNPFNGIGKGFSAVINGVEHVAQDIESLVSKAAGEIEALGIAVTGDISWLIKFLIEAGEDPVTTISQLSGRIRSMGGEVISTLETLASGIMTYGLMGFAQRKVTEALKPLVDGLPQSTIRGQAVANVHQTTLKTMQTKLDTLKMGGDISGLAWQGLSVDAMSTSFANISGTINGLTVPLEGDGSQARLNQICEQALVDIIVVGAIFLVCEMVVTIIVAIPALATGPGDLAVLGAGAGMMAATLEGMEVLVAADLLAWLLGSILIYVIAHPINLSHTSTPNNGPQGPNVNAAS
ncbi:MAG: hypothetical protein ACRDHZ_11990, partial [Ktedonobacteraceae bacterium]